MKLLVAALLLTLALAGTGAAFAIWPAVADAPWENHADGAATNVRDGVTPTAEGREGATEEPDPTNRVPFDDCYMGAGAGNCAAVHPEYDLLCVNPGIWSSNAGCNRFVAVPAGSVPRDLVQDAFDSYFLGCVERAEDVQSCLSDALRFTRDYWCSDFPSAPLCRP
jgi:hypothetical protein